MKKIALIFLPFLVTCNKVTTTSNVVKEEQQEKISHVILLAGGENCLGYSYSYHLQEIDGVSIDKFKEYQKGYSSVKISYKNMLNSGLVHKEQLSFVDTRIGQGKAADEGIRFGCLGPEVGIAEYLSNMRPNEEYYIIKFAGGGESSFKFQWNVDHGIYYHKMVEFFDQQLNKLVNQQINFDVSSFMFVQGESDAKNNNVDYGNYLEDFVNDVKLRYQKYAPINGMSFIDAGISSYYLLNYRNINNSKKEIMSNDSRHFYIDTILGNVTRNQDNMDRVHYDAKGEIKLGNLFAKAYLSMQNQIISEDKYILENRINNSLLEDKYVIETIRSGRYIKANFTFENDQITSDVIDNNLSIKDGICIKYCLAEDEEKIKSVNLRKVNLYIDNRVEFFKYSPTQKSFIKSTTDDEFINSIDGLMGKNDELIGYRINATIPNPFNNKIFVSFGMIKDGHVTFYHDEKIINSDVETYPYIENNYLVDNKNVTNGHIFGSISNLKATKGWELSNDEEQIYISKGSALNTVFAYQKNDINLSFNASINAKGVINYDPWPKFGIVLVDEEFNGVFYYVDAYGNGYSMNGTDLGYCLVKGGTFSNYVSLGYSVGTNSSVYQNDNYISLGIDREEDRYHFLFNGVTVKTIQNVTNIGLRKAYFGINTFNVSVNVKNYDFSD